MAVDWAEPSETLSKRLTATPAWLQENLKKKMMGPDVEIRSLQAAAEQAIMGCDSPILAVMETDSGKSLLFILPVFCSQGGVTIVVVPLIALREDLYQRCHFLCGVEFSNHAFWN